MASPQQVEAERAEEDVISHLSKGALRVMEVLERHPALDTLQIASRAELRVSVAANAVAELAHYGLVEDENGVYSLKASAVEKLLQTAV